MIRLTAQFDAEAALSKLGLFSDALKGTLINNIAGRIADNTFAEAFKLLSGTGAAWSYPVPVRTGNLRRSLWRITPAGYKGGQPNETYNLGPGEAYVGDSAEYARAIHDGRIFRRALSGGRGMGRPFLTDAMNAVLGNVKRYGIEENDKLLKEYGLG